MWGKLPACPTDFMAGTMTHITYLKGDATCPQAAGNKIICHVCNDRGGWGKGFVMALSKRWSGPEEDYRAWHRDRAANDFSLGAVHFVQVESTIWVANMVAQHGMMGGKDGPPIRYDAVEQGLTRVAAQARELSASVHMPRIGCGLAGGTWQEIEPIIVRTLCRQGVPVTVYDFA
jgi:O-acetyl-ADP-ribose deacetylase (regulator of RNase III)